MDFLDLSVFPLVSYPWVGRKRHLFAGTDVNVWKHLFLSVEGAIPGLPRISIGTSRASSRSI